MKYRGTEEAERKKREEEERARAAEQGKTVQQKTSSSGLREDLQKRYDSAMNSYNGSKHMPENAMSYEQKYAQSLTAKNLMNDIRTQRSSIDDATYNEVMKKLQSAHNDYSRSLGKQKQGYEAQKRIEGYDADRAELDQIQKEKAARDAEYGKKITAGMSPEEQERLKREYAESNKDIDAREAALEASTRMYERTGKVADQNYLATKQPGFRERSQKRDYGDPTKDQLRQMDLTYDAARNAAGEDLSAQPQTPRVTDRLGMYLDASDDDITDAYSRNTDVGTTDTYGIILREGDTKYWKNLSEDEVGRYYELLNKDPQQAYQFLEDMAPELGRRNLQNKANEINKLNSTPVISNIFKHSAAGSESNDELLMQDYANATRKIGMQAGSVVGNVVGGATSFVDDAAHLITGREIDPYNRMHEAQNLAGIVRQNTAEHVDRTFGDIHDPVLGMGMGDVYQSLMSGVDSLVGGMTLGYGYEALMGMGAASSTAKELYERGASNEQIAFGAVTAGAAETIFEHVSLDHFLSNTSTKSKTELVKQALAQAGVEGMEEFCTDIANTITEAINMKSQSEWAKAEQEGGFLNALKETIITASKSFMGGAISGGAMGAGGSAINLMGYNSDMTRYGDQMRKSPAAIQSNIDYANSNSVNADAKALAEQVASQMDADGKYTGSSKDLGKLADAVDTHMEAEAVKAEIKQKIEDSGQEVTPKLIDDVYKQVTSTADITLGPEQAKKIAEEISEDKEFSQRVSQRVYGKNVDRVIDQFKKEDAKSRIDQAAENRSESGQAEIKKTGEQVEIGKAVDSKKGVMIELSNGKQVSIDDLSFASTEQALAFDLIKKNGLSAEAANSLLESIGKGTGDLSTNDFILGVEEGYNYGRVNMDMSKIDNSSFFKNLTEEQQKFAYDLGKNDTASFDSAHTAKVNAAVTDHQTNWGSVSFAGSASYQALREDQKVQVDAIARIATSITHNKVVFYRSFIGKDGKLTVDDEVKSLIGMKEGDVPPHGAYIESTGTVYLDVNAGENGEGSIMYTAAHEFTHFIQDYSRDLYRQLGNFLAKEYGRDLDRLVAQKQYNDPSLSPDEAFDEVIADSMQTMFTDSNLSERLSHLKAENKTLWDHLKSFFADLFKKLQEIYKGVDPYTAEGRIVRSWTDKVGQIQDMFYEGLESAGSTYAKIGNNFTSNSYAGVPSQLAAQVIDDSRVQASPRTYNTPMEKFFQPISGSGKVKIFNNGEKVTTLEISERLARKLKATDKIKDIKGFLDSMEKFMTNAAVEYRFIGLEDVINAEITYDADTGRYIFSAMVKNGDYPVNFDFTTICKKRDAASMFIEKILGMKDSDGKPLTHTYKLSQSNLVKLNDAMREAGYETACLGCFVEAKRYNIDEWAGTIVSEWNDAVDRYSEGEVGNISDGEDISTDELTDAQLKDLDKYIKGLLKENTTQKKQEAYQRNLAEAKETIEVRQRDLELANEALDNARKSGDPKDLKAAEKMVREAKENLTKAKDKLTALVNQKKKESSIKPTEKIDALIKSDPYYRKHIKMADIVTKDGIAAISEKYPGLLEFIKTRYGTASPKLTQGFTPYNSEIAMLPDKVKKQSLSDYLYSIAGIRTQSFSDFKVEYVFDYLQMFADAAIRELPMHAYSKEISFAELFGKTGAKINMSVMYNIMNESYWGSQIDALRALGETEKKLDKIAKKYAGMYIDENGQLAPLVADREMADYFAKKYDGMVMPVQSIGYKDALALMKKEGYTSNVGTIGVGYGDYHVRQLLRDDNIRYVIPYHKSSLPTDVANLANLKFARDYTSVQNTLAISSMLYNGKESNLKAWLADNGFTNITAENAIDVIKEFNKQIAEGKVKVSTKKGAAGHGDFNLYTGKTGINTTNDPKLTVNMYVADSLNRGWLPMFYEFADEPNYYKVHFDFNVYDNVTGECAPQGPVSFNMGEFDAFSGAVSKYMKEIDDYRQEQYAEDKVLATIQEWEKKVDDSYAVKKSGRRKATTDSRGRQLTEGQQKFFEKSAIRDEQGRLIRAYHGTESVGFSIFDRSKTDDGRSFFFTDSNDIARSYSGTPVEFSFEVLNNIDKANEYIRRLETENEEDFHHEIVENDGKYELFKMKNSEDEEGEWIEDDDGYYVYEPDGDPLYTGDSIEDVLRNLDSGDYYKTGFAGNYPVYLNITNPLIVECDGENWDSLDASMIPGFVDDESLKTMSLELFRRDGDYYLISVGEYQGKRETKRMTINEIEGEYGKVIADRLRGRSYDNIERFYVGSEGKAKTSEMSRTRDFAEYAYNNGYDGVWFKDIDDTGANSNGYEDTSNVFVAFDPEQIKMVSNENPTTNPDVRYSDRVLMGSVFSGGGTLEAGLTYQMLDKEFAVEYNKKIASVYTDNHGKEHMFVGDIREFDSKAKQDVFYLHASPVCKNYGNANHNAGEQSIDITTAQATARVLDEQRPPVFTVENVKRYIGSEAFNIITDKLDELGYTWDVAVYKASDYGNASKRERMILRAVQAGMELPAKPVKVAQKTSWGEATKDLWDTDLEPSYLVKSKIEAIRNTPELKNLRLTKLDKPLMIYDTTQSKKATFAWADELAPTLTTKCGDARIIMPDGKVYKPTPRFMGRIQGLPDNYKYPKSRTTAFTIIGNGIPTQLTKAVNGGLLDSAYSQTHEGKALYSGRKSKKGLNVDKGTYSAIISSCNDFVTGKSFELSVYGELVVKHNGNLFLVGGSTANPYVNRAVYIDVEEDDGEITHHENIIEEILDGEENLSLRKNRSFEDVCRLSSLFYGCYSGKRIGIRIDDSGDRGRIFADTGDSSIGGGSKADRAAIQSFNGRDFARPTVKPVAGSKEIVYAPKRQQTLIDIAKSIISISDELESDSDYGIEIKDKFQIAKGLRNGDREYIDYIEYIYDNLDSYVGKGLTYNRLREQIGEILDKYEYVTPYRRSARTGSTDARTLLSNALSTVAQNDIERSYIERYQAKIAEINDAQQELAEVSRQLKDISFSKGKRDMERLRELREQSNALKNRINTFDKQLLRLQASQPLKNVVARERVLAEKKAKAEFKEWYEGKREQARVREVKEKIKKLSHEMQKQLLKPTDTQYIPAPLARGIVDICMMIDPTSDQTGTKVEANLNSAREAMLHLKQLYEEHIKDSDDYMLSSEYDEQLSKNIDLLAKAVGNRKIRELSKEELEDVYTVLKDVKTLVKKARDLIDKDQRYTAYAAGKDIILRMENLKKQGLTTNKIEDLFREWTVNPMRAVQEMSGFDDSSMLVQLFNDLNAGRIKADTFSMTAHKKFDSMRMDKAGDKAFTEAVQDANIEVQGTNGKPVKISKMQAMQAILTAEREEANKGRQHLNTAVKFTDVELEVKGKAVEAFDKGHTVYVNDSFMAAVLPHLTDWDLEYMDRAREFFRKDSRLAINEVALKVKGRLIAGEDAYIPYIVNKDQVKTQSERVKMDYGIMSAGILKSVQNNAQNQIIIRGLNTVIDNHIDQVAKIYGLAIPVRNWDKVFNVRMTDKDGGTYVKEAIRDTWHDGGVKLLDQAVADLQTNRANESVPIMNAIKSAFVTSTLASNISVWMKQAASYPTAGAVLSASSLSKGLADYFGGKMKLQDLYDEIDAHTPQHYTRRQGLSMIELGEFNQSKGWQNRLNKKLGKMSPMNWIQTMDVATTAALWYASKAEAQKDGFKVGTEQFWKATTDYYNKVLEETQPMYDSLHRAEVTKNAGFKNIIMFQTQPIQNSGILREGTMRMRMAKKQYGKNSEQYKKASKQFGMAVGSQMASHFTFTMMTLIAAALLHKMNPWRDEDKELTAESVSKEFAKEFGENVFSAALPIVGSYAVSIMEKFAGSSYDVVSDSMVDKINGTIDTFAKLADKDSMKEHAFDNFLNCAMDVASYAGIPAKNLYNIINGARLHIMDAMEGEIGSFEAGVTRTASQDENRVYEAFMTGDTDAISKFKDKYEGTKFQTEVKKALRSNDPRIEEAARAKMSGDLDKYMRIAREIKAERNFSQDDIVRAVNMVINELTEDEPSEPSAKAKALFTDSDYKAAIKSDPTMLDDIMDEIVATAVINGKAEAEAIKQETSDIKSAIGESYKTGAINMEQAVKLLTEYGGMEEDEARAKADYWKITGENPDVSITESALKKYHAEAESLGISLDTYVKFYDLQKGANGVDADGDGRADSGTVQKEIMEIIDSLPITAEQKDALYLTKYKATNLKKAPWH